MTGKLSIVGTPIGNLEDITLRALRTLRECDIIVCEDTRVTKNLLFHFDIQNKPLWGYNEHLHVSVMPKVSAALSENKHIALVSDAGMPAISDPGSYLIHTVRKELPDCTIEIIGGVTALTNAIAWSGIDTANGFLFAGFAPHKKGRETLCKKILDEVPHQPVVVYESSHRIEKLILWFAEHAPSTHITICREITKMFEECRQGTPSEILRHLSLPHKTQGEFVVIFTN